MAGSSIQLASGAFSNGLSASLTSPNRTGMIAEYIFGVDSTRSRKNVANNAAPLAGTGAGTPVYNANSVVLSGSVAYGNGIAGYDTGLQFPNDVTIIVLRKKLAQGTLTNVATVWFGSQSFRGFLDIDNWNFYNNNGGLPGTDLPKIAAPVDADFHFEAGVGPNGGKGVLYVSNGGVLTSSTSTIDGTAQATGQPTIKIVPTGNYQIELAYAAIYSRVLTSQEVTDAYNALKAYYALKGVTIS